MVRTHIRRSLESVLKKPVLIFPPYPQCAAGPAASRHTDAARETGFLAITVY